MTVILQHRCSPSAVASRATATILLCLCVLVAIGFDPIQRRQHLFGSFLVVDGLSLQPSSSRQRSRREILYSPAAATLALLVQQQQEEPLLQPANAAEEAIPITTAASPAIANPPSGLVLPNTGLSIPRIGYSMYKTVEDQVEEGVKLALKSGTRHFDAASQYGTNEVVGKVLREYVRGGVIENDDDVDVDVDVDVDDDYPYQQQRRRQDDRRRDRLFVTHKVSNLEQSTDKRSVQRAVMKQRKVLGIDRLDLVMIHSPLTDTSRRLATYEALVDLQVKGKIGAVGVCHYGVNPLEEIVDSGLPPPAVIQLSLSPFNQHKDVASWANDRGSVLSCAAWSKLSSVDGPQKGWTILGELAKERSMTKQQVLIRWAIQRGYLCVPRSSSKYKIERQAITENSWRNTSHFVLSSEEMSILDGLDEQIPAGQLGLRDGWDESEIVDSKWDPTLVV